MKSRHRSARARPLQLAQLFLLMSAGPLWANPEDGVVVAGSAAINAVPGEVTITQSSDRAIINWQDFSIGEGETTRFVQPGSSSVTLNRVTGGNPSQIFGQLNANGHVYLINRNGVLFGKNAQVNVHGLVTTTHDIDNAAFMAGDDRFDIPGRADAAIVNLGHITVEGAGLAALVAPAVRNDGVITARLGKVALASATGFTLDLYGDQLLQLAVDPVTLRAVNLDGTPVSALVENGGEIIAEGGTVLLTANAAREVVDNVINVSGIISATSAQQVGGTIVLQGGDGVVRVTGKLDASGEGTASGGEIRVLSANTVDVEGAQLRAEGGAQGGNGGFIETSGAHVLLGDVAISAKAPRGFKGLWLIDPSDIIIDSTYASSIVNTLNNGTDVTVQTNPFSTGVGDITVSAAINKTAGTDATLTLQAYNNINVNASITSTSGQLNVVLDADSDSNGVGEVNLGNVTLNANGGIINANTETVTIGSGATLESTLNVETFNMAGGTLSGAGNINVSMYFNWSGGTIGGSGVLTTPATSITAITGHSVALANSRIWNNSGWVDWTGDGGSYDYFLLYNTSQFNNLASGTFHDNTAPAAGTYAILGSSSTASITNAGTWYKGGSQTRVTGTPFSNAGSLTTYGLFWVQTDGTDTGSWIATDGGTVQFSGTRVLGSGASLNGVVHISGGTFTASTGSHVGNILQDGNFTISGGTLDLSSGTAVPMGSLTVTGGTLTGSDDITIDNISGNFHWSGGTIGGSGTLSTPAGSISLLDGHALTLADSRVWENGGNVTWSGDGGTYDYFYLNDTSLFRNLAGGTVSDTSAASYSTLGYSNTASVVNEGNWTKSGPGQTSFSATSFNNTGVVNATGGTLNVGVGGTDTGSWYVTSALAFSGGTRTLNSGASIGGGGTVLVNGSTLTLAAGSSYSVTGGLTVSSGTLDFSTGTAIALTTLTVSGGTVTGSDIINIGGSFTWSGGTLRGTGVLNTLTGSTTTMNGNMVTLDDSRLWNNAGTVTWTGDGGFDYFYQSGTSQFINQSGGTFIDATAPSGTYYAVIGNSTNAHIYNQGTWIKSNAGTTYLYGTPFDNSGTVTVDAGTWQLEAGGTDTGAWIANGEVRFANGVRTLSPGAGLGGTGSFTVNGGTLTFTGATYNLTTPMLVSNGTLTVANSAVLYLDVLNVSGGTVTSDGTTNVATSLAWSGGTVNGTGSFNTQAGSTTALNGNLISLAGDVIWTNDGTVTWSGDGGTYDLFYLYNNSQLINNGIFNDTTAATTSALLGYSASARVINNGDWNKTGTGQTGFTYTPFDNNGTMDVSAGMLQIGVDGTDTGAWNVTGGSTLQFSGGTRTLNAGTTFTGPVQLAGATFSVPASVTIVFPDLTMSSGTLTDAGTVSLPGSFVWSGGTIGGTGVLSTPTGSITTMNGNSITLADSVLWNNAGTVTWSGDGGYDYFYLNNTSQFNNLAGGVFNDTTAAGAGQYAQIGYWTTATINNVGTWNKSGAGQTNFSSTVFNNSGTVNVTGGTLNVAVNGTDTGAWVDTADLVFSSGTRTVNAGASYNGLVRVAGATLNIATATTIGFTDLNLSSGTVNTGGTVEISGSFVWSGGTIGGTGVLNTLSGSVTTMNGNSVTLADSAVWNNAGTVTWSGDGGYDYFYVSNTSQFNNLAGGVFNDTTAAPAGQYAQIGYWTTATINNAGTWNKSGSGQTTVSSSVFNNSGTVNVTAGTLRVGVDGTDTGAWNTSGGGILQFTGGTRTLNAGTTFSGAVQLTGGTLAIPGAVTIVFPDLTVSGGTLSNDGTVNLPTSFAWSGGTVRGAGILNTLNGSTTLLNGDFITLADSLVWNNAGTVIWSGDGGYDYFYLNNNSQFNNLAGGMFNDITAAGAGQYALLGSWTTAAITNAGVWTKSGTGQTSIMSTPFTNNGTVNVSLGAGLLNIGVGGTDSGAWNIDGNLMFSGGTRTLGTGASVSGTGTLTVNGATLNLSAGAGYGATLALAVNSGTANFATGAPVAINTLTVSGGTLTGSDTLNVANSFIWSGGTVRGSGVLNTLAGSTTTLNGDYIALADSIVWNNAGTLTWSGNGGAYDYFYLNGTSLFHNLTGGVFIDATAATTNAIIGNWNTAKVTNDGSWTKTGSGLTSLWYSSFDNSATGAVNVNAGTFDIGGGGNSPGAFVVAAGATLEFSAAHALGASTQISGAGSVRFSAAGSTFTSSGTTLSTTPFGMTVDAGPVVIGSITQPLHGTVVDNGDGTFTYTPDGTHTGTDTFTYTVLDGQGGSALATVTMTVNGSLTFVAVSTSRYYGDPNPVFTYTVNGLLNGDLAQTVLSGSPLLSTTATSVSNAGNYTIVITQDTMQVVAGQNYVISGFTNGTLTVTQAPLTININNASREYGLADPAFTVASYNGFRNGDDASVLSGLTLSSTAATGSNVGTYAITGSGATTANYAITYVDGALTITQAPLTITANDATREYGSANPAFTASYSGLRNNDDAAVVSGLAFNTTATETSNVGSYGIVASGATAANYAITYVNGTLTITPAMLSLIANDLARLEGAVNPTLTYTVDGLKGSDDASIIAIEPTLNTSATVESAPGNYAITISGAALANGNYVIAYVNGTMTVQSNTVPEVPPSVENPQPTIVANLPFTTPEQPKDELVVIGQDNQPSAKIIELDTLPPSLIEGAGAPELPDTFIRAVAKLTKEDYSPEQRAAFFKGIDADRVIAELKSDGQDKLAELFATTAAGGDTDESDLRNLLAAKGLSTQQYAVWLGVFERMRHLGMTKHLAPALEVLRNKPDAADEFDDGKTGGFIDIEAPGSFETRDGMVEFSGRVKSDSKVLYLRVNGRWAFVDEQGRFRVKLALPAGTHVLALEATDPSGARAASEVKVVSRGDGKPAAREGRKVALLIGVEEYENAIPELETPVADAKEIAGKLAKDYGFETQMLTNPSKREVLDRLRKLASELTEQDSLMVFYAGHGYLVPETGRGYWLPRDAATGNPRNWISNRDVARLFRNTPAKQILMVSDSCYSGAFTREGTGVKVQGGSVRDLRAVMALSSGGDTPVWDGGGEGHSIFASQLMSVLDKNDPALGSDLFKAVRQGVSKVSPQVPGYGAMVSAGYDSGADYALK